MPTCTQCSAEFEVTDEDLEFYKKVSPEVCNKKFAVPPPTLCPDCRKMHLCSFRNEHTLHHNTCAKTGKSIVSIYKKDSDVVVYDNDAWWSDDWDAKTYGRDIDFTRPFFEQFEELWKEVPKMARVQQGESINSTYTNTVSYLKNCYLIFASNENEDCLYSTVLDRSKNCIDCQSTIDSELCLECINVDNCYNCYFSQDCSNCSDSKFLKSCVGCRNCFGCINLRDKEFCIFNEPHSKEEYEKKMKELNLGDNTVLKHIREKIHQFFLKHPFRFYQGVHNENISGNNITNCKNAHYCFDTDNVEDCKYCIGIRSVKDAYDVFQYGCTATNELLYMSEGIGHGVSRVLFSKLVWGGSSDVVYGYECFASRHCFGCTGLQHDEYCILNKKYSKDEYEELSAKLIDHMQDTGEWGKFFPISMNPFAYNETYAHDIAPLTKEKALEYGWRWLDEGGATDNPSGEIGTVPESINDADTSLSSKVFLCDATKRPFKIIPQELSFYKENNVALPRLCPAERHRRRIEKRNPFRLWGRECDRCKAPIKTSYAPDRPEIVYCEECYLAEVY